MTKLSSSLFLSLALAAVVATCGSASAQSPLPAPTGYVNDFAGVIDQQTKDRLETTLTNLEREQQIQFAVVTVDSTNGQEIFDYSLAVARGWGIGSKDTSKPSLLLLVAIKDRKYFTQVSRHLEGELPDGLVGQIQREQLVPAFAKQFGIQYPLARPDDDLVSFLLAGQDAIPQTFVFDRQGQLVQRFVGFGSDTGIYLDSAVETALKTPAN